MYPNILVDFGTLQPSSAKINQIRAQPVELEPDRDERKTETGKEGRRESGKPTRRWNPPETGGRALSKPGQCVRRSSQEIDWQVPGVCGQIRGKASPKDSWGEIGEQCVDSDANR